MSAERTAQPPPIKLPIAPYEIAPNRNSQYSVMSLVAAITAASASPTTAPPAKPASNPAISRAPKPMNLPPSRLR